MNDLNNGRDINVNGNFIINDNSKNINKSFEECTNEELREEYQHRTNLLENEVKEKKSKYKKISIYFSICIIILFSWQFHNTNYQVFSFLIAIGGLVIPTIIYFSNTEKQTEFEVRQIHKINEIIHLLKERT